MLYHRMRNRTCEAVFWAYIFMLYILCLWKVMPELGIDALINYIVSFADDNVK